MLWLRPSGNGKAEAYDGNNDLQSWRNNPHSTDINLLLHPTPSSGTRSALKTDGSHIASPLSLQRMPWLGLHFS